MVTKAKIAIDASGLKQVYIARKLKMDYTLLSRYVSGEREMPDDVARALAKILRVPLSNIVEGKK